MKPRHIVLTILLVLLLASTANAQEPSITDVVITTYQNTVYIYFNIDGCYTTEIDEVLKSGIPTTFTFNVNLQKLKGIWFDTNIVNKTFRHTIRYDTLMEEYTITKEEDGKKSIVIKDLENAKRIMARVKFYPMVSLHMLQKGETYRLRIKGELDKVDIPESLRYVLFFVNLWRFETNWYVEEFVY
jgi:hypothetical protein